MDIVIREIESKDYISVSAIWRAIYRYTNWKGERKQTQKRWLCHQKGCTGLGEHSYRT